MVKHQTNNAPIYMTCALMYVSNCLIIISLILYYPSFVFAFPDCITSRRHNVFFKSSTSKIDLTKSLVCIPINIMNSSLIWRGQHQHPYDIRNKKSAYSIYYVQTIKKNKWMLPFYLLEFDHSNKIHDAHTYIRSSMGPLIHLFASSHFTKVNKVI